jgi:hypothetical protein
MIYRKFASLKERLELLKNTSGGIFYHELTTCRKLIFLENNLTNRCIVICVAGTFLGLIS